MSTPAAPLALTGSDGQHHSGVSVLRGWTIRETSGAAVARVKMHAGNSTSGAVVGEVSLAANGAETIWLDDGIACAGGIYVDVITGAVEGSLFV